jgi:hypothetical protein
MHLVGINANYFQNANLRRCYMEVDQWCMLAVDDGWWGIVGGVDGG